MRAGFVAQGLLTNMECPAGPYLRQPSPGCSHDPPLALLGRIPLTVAHAQGCRRPPIGDAPGDNPRHECAAPLAREARARRAEPIAPSSLNVPRVLAVASFRARPRTAHLRFGPGRAPTGTPNSRVRPVVGNGRGAELDAVGHEEPHELLRQGDDLALEGYGAELAVPTAEGARQYVGLLHRERVGVNSGMRRNQEIDRGIAGERFEVRSEGRSSIFAPKWALRFGVGRTGLQLELGVSWHGSTCAQLRARRAHFGAKYSGRPSLRTSGGPPVDLRKPAGVDHLEAPNSCMSFSTVAGCGSSSCVTAAPGDTSTTMYEDGEQPRSSRLGCAHATRIPKR